MNKVFRLKKHSRTGQIVVVSELARGAGKSGRAQRMNVSTTRFDRHAQKRVAQVILLSSVLLGGPSAWAAVGTAGGNGGTPQDASLAGAAGTGSQTASPYNNGGLGGCASCAAAPYGTAGEGLASSGGTFGSTSLTAGGQGNTGGGIGGQGLYGGAGGGGGGLETQGVGGGGGGGIAGSSYSGGGGGGGGGVGTSWTAGGSATTISGSYTGGKGGNGGSGGGGTLFIGHGYTGGGGGGGAGFYVGSGNNATFSGTLTGGSGGNAYYNPNDNSYGGGGGGGAGLIVGASNATTLAAGAVITGGTGGDGNWGGAGGAGVVLGDNNAFTLDQNATINGGTGGTGAFAGQGGAGIMMTGNSSAVIQGTVAGGSAGSGSGGSTGDAVTLSGGGNLLSINATAKITGNLRSISANTNGGDSLALGGGGGSIGANQLIGFQNYNVTGGAWTLTGTGNSTQNWSVTGGATGLIGTSTSLVGNIDAGGGSYVSFQNNSGGTYAGVLSGAGDVAVNGGTLAFSGANTNSGAVVLTGATLNLTGDGTLGNNAYVTMNNASTLDFSASNLAQNSGTQNLKDLVSDAGGPSNVVHLGGARLNITGAGGGIFYGTMDGTSGSMVTVSGGQWGLGGTVSTGLPFQIGGGTQVNVYGAGTITNGVNIQSYGLLDASNTTNGFTTAFLSGAGAVALGDQNLTLTNGDDNVFDGRITGSGGLHLLSGTQTFTNQFGPIYSGNTVIDPGAKIVLGSASTLGSSAHVINNGTLSITGTAANTAKIVSLAGNGSVLLNGSSSRALEISNGSDTFAGVISNPIAGSAGNIIISGGTQTFSGVNTYTGTTTVTNGANGATLALSGNGSIANSSQVNLSGGGAFDISQTTQGATVQQVVSNSVPGAGTVNLGDQLLTISNPTAATFDYKGQLTGQQGGIRLQQGQMNLSYASTYEGDTIIDSGATIALTGAATLANSTIEANGTLDGSSSDLSNAAGNFAQIGGLAGSGTVKLGFNTLQINNAQNTVFDGTLEQTKNTGGANGFLVLQGGTQTFNNQVNLVSSMVVQQGATLKFGQQSSFSTPIGFNNDGTLDFSASSAQQSAGRMSGIGSLILGSGGMKLTDANTGYGGVISGTGGLEFTQGQNFLGGANTYSGATQIDSGASLLLLSNGSLANSEVHNAGTFDLSQLGAASTTIGGISGAGTLNLDSKTLNLAAAQGSFEGTLNGSGTLNIAGGQQIFNANATQTAGFTGNTTIQGGLLEVGDANHSTAFLPGDVLVGGTLRGHGTIGGNVENQGTVFPGGSIGILSVGGNYTQAATGSLNIEVMPSANPVAGVDYDQLQVQGTATLDGALNVLVDSGNYTVGTQYDIVKANGGVTGHFAHVAYNPLFSAYITPQLNYTANQVSLQLAPTPGPTTSMPGLAFTTASAAVAQPWITQHSLFDTAELFAQLPDNNMHNDVWIKALRGQGGANAAAVDQRGILVGGALASAEHVDLGLAFAALRTQTQTDYQTVDGKSAGLYGYGIYRQDGWRGVASVGAGRLAQDSTRALFPTDLVAKGSTQGWYGSLSLQGSYHQSLGKTAYIEPYAGVALIHTHTNAFTESGADLLDLQYDAQSHTTTQMQAGLKTGLNLTVGSAVVRPWVSAGLVGYAGDTNPQQNLTLGAVNSSLSARAAPGTALQTGAGIALSAPNSRWLASVAYHGQHSHDSHFNAVEFKLQYHW